MDFTFNNNAVSSITYNGLDINILRYNGTTVWEKNRDYDPADYGLTQVSYISKTTNASTQFQLASDYSIYDTYEIQMKWKPRTSFYHGSCLIGHRIGANNNTFGMFREYYAYLDYGSSGRRTVDSGSYDNDTIYTYQIWVDDTKVGHIKNVDTAEQDTDRGFGCNSSPMTGMPDTLPFYIFELGDTGTVYYVKVYDVDSEEVKHHWVPCTNNTNNAICWFDIKTADIVYANSNSGLVIGTD